MKKLLIFIGIVFLLFTIGSFFFVGYITNVISGRGSGSGMMSGLLSNVPVFKTGAFSEDGNYFAYTYEPEIERPDVDGNISIRGFGFPTYFQVMETNTGKRLLDKPYETGKSDQLYVVLTEGNLVWLMESVYHEGDRLALYDLQANKFRFEFGAVEKLNATVSWKNANRFFINPTDQNGLLLEANDKRYYRIDPNTGKAAIVQGKFELVDYSYADDFQVSALRSDADYRTQQHNGSRVRITDKNGENGSEDDFIEVNFLTLTKNKKGNEREASITYYKNQFFVLSPITTDNEKDMELTMLDKNTLKTVWKIQLPQKELKTMIPRYRYERFFIKGDQLLVTNNDYLITIDLDKGTILKTIALYPEK